MVLTSLLGACGDDDESATDGDTDTSASATTAVTDRANALEVTMTETDDEVKIGIPATIKGGVVNLTLRNSGQSLHSLQFAKVNGNHTIAELAAFLQAAESGAPIIDWISEGGGIGTVAPGQTGTASFELSEGRHFVYDDETDTNDKPNAEKTGGIIEVNVTKGGGGDLPEADATITASEYKFTVDPLKAGNTTVRFENDGTQYHHLIGAPMLPGKTIDDVKAFFSSEEPPSGPPPIDFDKGVGTAVMDSGRVVVTDLQLQPGDYAIMCFISDRAGGAPHFTLGMLQKVTVA